MFWKNQKSMKYSITANMTLFAIVVVIGVAIGCTGNGDGATDPMPSATPVSGEGTSGQGYKKDWEHFYDQ